MTGRTKEDDVMATYTAQLEREADGRWTVELLEEPRVHTWGNTVTQALTRIREAAAMWFDTDEASIELIPAPVLPKTALRIIEQAGHARDQARTADRVAIEKTKKAAVELARRGISMRDAAAILGISHQRVHQLLAEDANEQRRTG
jgi:predicted RNase H-like HicB family nuclease